MKLGVEWVLSAVLGLALAGHRVQAEDDPGRPRSSIGAAELRLLLDGGGGTKVIDVRSGEEYEQGHLPAPGGLAHRPADVRQPEPGRRREGRLPRGHEPAAEPTGPRED